jgi:hypothetical protein
VTSLCSILYFVRIWIAVGIKYMGMHNRSENCRSAMVTLCAYPTHAHTVCVHSYLCKLRGGQGRANKQKNVD